MLKTPTQIIQPQVIVSTTTYDEMVETRASLNEILDSLERQSSELQDYYEGLMEELQKAYDALGEVIDQIDTEPEDD